MTSIHKYTHTRSILTCFCFGFVSCACVRARSRTLTHKINQNVVFFVRSFFFFLYALRENIHAVSCRLSDDRVSFRIIIIRQNRSVCCWKLRLVIVIVAYYFYLRSCWRQYITLTHSTNQNLHRNCLRLFFFSVSMPLSHLCYCQKNYSQSSL